LQIWSLISMDRIIASDSGSPSVKILNSQKG
jgi:hypothetical protein